MGESGFPTRVLATAWGGIFTYAAPNASEGTASGQVSARLMRHLYRVEKFSRGAKVYGVIAEPVRHSISPAVHNRAFQSHRLDESSVQSDDHLVHGITERRRLAEETRGVIEVKDAAALPRRGR